MLKKTFKISYSILNAWANGKWEDAVSYYLGRDLPKTPEIELGSLKHKLWGDYTYKTKKMHPEIGDEVLVEPITEQKYQKIIPFSSDYQILLRGTPDLTDRHIIYEYKCGMTEPATYVDTLQLDYYKLLIPRLTLGIYKCHNPYTKETKTGIKFLGNYNAENALEHIITFSGEMIDYLESNKSFKDYHV